jgi:hypothetical protein
MVQVNTTMILMQAMFSGSTSTLTNTVQLILPCRRVSNLLVMCGDLHAEVAHGGRLVALLRRAACFYLADVAVCVEEREPEAGIGDQNEDDDVARVEVVVGRDALPSLEPLRGVSLGRTERNPPCPASSILQGHHPPQPPEMLPHKRRRHRLAKHFHKSVQRRH